MKKRKRSYARRNLMQAMYPGFTTWTKVNGVHREVRRA